MGGICKNKLANDMIRDIQATKAPLDEERARLTVELSALVAAHEAAEADIRARQVELNDLIAPLDRKMSDIGSIGRMKNQDLANRTLERERVH